MLRGRTVSPAVADGLRYAPSDRGRALLVRNGTALRYNLGRSFPADAGALELRFRPDFPQTSDEPERTLLTLTGKAGVSVTLSYHPVGFRWEFMLRARRKQRRARLWYGKAKQGTWSHFLLVWDKQARPLPAISLHHNGRLAESDLHDLDLSGLTSLNIRGSRDAEVSLDELVIYNRAFTAPQARFLSATFKRDGDRFAALADRLARDERSDERRRARRKSLVERLKGKVGRLIHLRAQKPQDFTFPEGVRATGIRPEDVGEIDLSRFDVIWFPQGGRYQLTAAQKRLIIEYVENGGGYVGSCQGAFFASKLGLLDFDCFTFREGGLIHIRLENSPITRGFGRRIIMHHGNGPIMIPRKGCRIVGSYVMGDTKRRYGAILTGERGKGRVVLFGPHPLGGGFSFAGKHIAVPGERLGTAPLAINAMLYAARVIG